MNKPVIGIVIHTSLRDQIFSPDDLARLREIGDIRMTESEFPITKEEAYEILAGCEIGIGSWNTPFPTPALIEACPELKLWVHAAGSVRHFFASDIELSGIMIASCKHAIAISVAELTFAEIVFGLRRTLPDATANRLGYTGVPAGLKTLFEATIGIIGASDIGRLVIDLLKPFGCRILLYDPVATDEIAGVRKIDNLVELCAACDVVTLHVPSLPETRYMLTSRHFKAMRDDAVFINTARGACVDEAALIAELSAGRLFAFLDVTDPEPAAKNSPFRKLPNVVLTSHNAGPKSYRIGYQVVNDIEKYLRGDSPTHVITADMIDLIA